MNWSMSKQLVALVLAVATLVGVCIVADAQVPAAKKDKEPPDPDDNPNPKPPPPPKPEPGDFKGNVNGQVASVLRIDSLPGLPTFKVAKVVDVKAGLVQLWNGSRDALGDRLQKNELKQADGHRLYDHKFFFAEATSDNKLFLQLSPKKQNILLGFRLPGNKITCRAEAFPFDKDVVITFDLDLWIVIATKGPASDPLVLRSAFLTVHNGEVRVSDVFGDEVNVGASIKLNNTIVDLRKEIQPAIDFLNHDDSPASGLLRPFVNQGFTVVTPFHTLPGVQTTADLLLELEPAPPVVTPIRR
jgi:hypothetical protein